MSGGVSPGQLLSLGQAFLEQLMFDSKGPPLWEATAAHTVECMEVSIEQYSNSKVKGIT